MKISPMTTGIRGRQLDPRVGAPDDDGIRGQLRELFKFPRYYILSSSYWVAKSGQRVESELEGVPLDNTHYIPITRWRFSAFG